MNNLQINNCQNNMAFTGKLYLKGKWPEELRQAFTDSVYVKDMMEQNDIFAHIKSKEDYDAFYTGKVPKLYRIKVRAYKQNSCFNWLKNLLGIGEGHFLTGSFHSQKGTIKCLDDNHFSSLRKKLGI